VKGRNHALSFRNAFRCAFYLYFAFRSTQPLAKTDQAAIVAFAQETAVRALNFRQGDIGSLTRARADFTPEAWKEFMKNMEGCLDQKGAPTFSSSFVPSRDAVVVGQENGIVHLRIPGTLKQTQNRSSTTYRAAIEVRAGSKPIKLQHLEQITCGGASTACQ
jgi:hypothetical protein